MDTSEAQPQEFLPPPHVTQEQQLPASQQESIDHDDTVRLPRIPVMANGSAQTMTLQELWDWKAR